MFYVHPIHKNCWKVHVPNFGGLSGSEDRDDNSTQSINIRRVGDKCFKEWGQKIGGRRVGDNNILTFYAIGSTKKCHFKKLHFGQFFLFVFVKFRDS